MKRPTEEELNQIEARAARVAMEAFMLTLREGLKPYGPEGETGAILEFYAGTTHEHGAFIVGTGPGRLTFTFRFDGAQPVPMLAKVPMRCKVGPVLQALLMNDCPELALVVCDDAKGNSWLACGRPEHQQGAVKREPIPEWLEREGWVGEKT